MTRISGGQILVTGGSGFIGKYVVALLQKEFDVVVVDQTKPNYKTKFQKINLLEPFTISKDFEKCIHLAAIVGGIQYFTKHSVENIRDNPRMVGNVFDACVNSNVNQVVYTSSSVVYQHQKKFPFKENDVLSSPPPTSAYGLSKLIGEHFCKAYHEQHGLNYTVLRPFNAYGPGEEPDPDYAHVIPHLIKKVLSNQYPVEIYGSGNQSRTFTHGMDIANAYLSSIKNKNALNEIFNVSGNKEFKINEVLKRIWKIANKKKPLKIKHLPEFPHDVKRRYPSNKKISKKLKWKPKINFDDGLKETMEWIKNEK
tara:strand:+ start:2088 stop:3020 length:933 start_codon:yes stop_codon:yes gene_type:complete